MMPSIQRQSPDVAEGGIGQERDQDADGDHQLIQRHHRAANVFRRDLRQIKRRGEGQNADRHAQDQRARSAESRDQATPHSTEARTNTRRPTISDRLRPRLADIQPARSRQRLHPASSS